MYRLFNRLFGWDYIRWSDAITEGVSKVIVLASGSIAYRQHTYLPALKVIRNPLEVDWLTCKPEKYFKYVGTRYPAAPEGGE